MIRLERVSKNYEKFKAVQEVSFEVKEAERFVLLGSSGSGKTTTLKMINRLIHSDSGSIYVDGKETKLFDPIQLRRRIGYVMQHAGLFPHLSVLENISLVPRLLKWSKDEIFKRAEHLIEVFGLSFPRFKDLKPAQLSGGQQQRIGIVRALMANPPILLMDEPFGALDPLSRIALRKEFSKLEELKNKTIILVTHDIQEALELGDRIGIMDKGLLLQVDKPLNFLFQPATDYVREFFSEQLYTSVLKEMKITQLLNSALFADTTWNQSGSNRILHADEETRVSTILDQMLASKSESIQLEIWIKGTIKSINITEEQLLMAFLFWKKVQYSHSDLIE